MPDVISQGLIGFYIWLFLLAAVHKLRAVTEYKLIMASYLKGEEYSGRWVLLIATVELLTALLLIFPQTKPMGLCLVAFILLGYGSLMALPVYRGKRDINCGCAGPASTITVGWPTLLRNLVCAAMALCLVFLPVISVQQGLLSALMSISTAVFIIVVYLSVEQVIQNQQIHPLKG